MGRREGRMGSIYREGGRGGWEVYIGKEAGEDGK